MSLQAPSIYFHPATVGPLVMRQFGLTLTELQGVADAAYRAFVQVSALHPKGFNGTSAWAEATSHLRATLIPKGWKPTDPQGQPRIVSKGGKLAITVSSGNSDTGVPERIPQTRNDKGSQTAGNVEHNARQHSLFVVTESDLPPPSATDGGEALWMLLYYIDFDARELRFELSKPTAMSEADKVNAWSTRYIFPPLQFGPEADSIRDDESPDINFDIMPKQL